MMRVLMSVCAALILVALIPAAYAADPGAGPLASAFFLMADLQRTLHQDLAAAVRGVTDGGGAPVTAVLTLLLVSFGYGVFHAVGPGHGKAVIATHAAASGDALRRSVWMALLAALVQGTSAVVLVGGAFLLLHNGARWAAREAETLMEPISAAAIIGVGVLLLWRCWRFRPGQVSRPCGHGCGPDTHHDHSHHDHSHHDHSHQNGACGHAHLPSPDVTSSPVQAALTAVAVGLRPCSGAILVLVLAFGLKLWGAGIAAVYAMALGTGVTVAALAALARGSRRVADRLAAVGEGAAARWGWGFALAGALVLLVLGSSLLADALTRPAHPLL